MSNPSNPSCVPPLPPSLQASRGSERARVVSQLKFLLCDPLVPATARQLEPADELELNRVRLKLRDLLNSLVERGVSGGPAPSVVVALSAWCQGRWAGFWQKYVTQLLLLLKAHPMR